MSRRPATWVDLRAEMLHSTAHAVGTLYRRFQAAANRGYAERGWKDATLAHVQFLCETDEAGTRLSDVAAALNLSKQYVGKLAREMAAKRLIALRADPADARATLATPTERGRAFLQDACDVRAELEAAFLGKLSKARAAAWAADAREMSTSP